MLTACAYYIKGGLDYGLFGQLGYCSHCHD